MYILKS